MSYSRRRTAVIFHDLLVVLLSFGLAFLVRYNLSLNSLTYAHWQDLYNVLPIVLGVQGIILWWSKLYKGLWRFASIPDLWNIIRAAISGALAISLVLFLYNRLEGIPRLTLVLYPVFLIMLLGVPRLLYRLLRERTLYYSGGVKKQKILLVGAGRAGEMLARDILRDKEYSLVGFLDDNAKLKGSKIHGIPVLGSIETLSHVAARINVDVIVIATPSATNAQMQKIVTMCEDVNIKFRTLPRLQDMMNGQAPLSAIREVSIDDLLGRDSVTLDKNLVDNELVDKVVLVSGGGGSIGAELCRQIAKLGPKELIIFDHSEYNLYKIEQELRKKFSTLKLYARLGSVDDAVAVDQLMKRSKPEVVFHAAAYKHVPMLENQIREAVQNNIMGTQVLALAADKYSVENFVLISTDKAVNPANIMGSTKRVAEIYCQNLNTQSKTHFVTVRFGNVLDSAGSVVPLFKEQIRKGGPVTVTHPEITRYFMTIPEASQLIMQAGVMGNGGEIFVLDMGQPIKISYLAEQMIRLSGKEPGRDIEIVYTGLRPGEKLYEELFHEQEALTKTGNEKIFLSHSRRVEWKTLETAIQKIEKAVDEYDEETLKDVIRHLVPEYVENDSATPAKVVPITVAKKAE